MELRGFVRNFHIHVYVRDLSISTIGYPIFCTNIGGPIVGIYKTLKEHRIQLAFCGGILARLKDTQVHTRLHSSHIRSADT